VPSNAGMDDAQFTFVVPEIMDAEADLPPAILDPLLRFKVDVWHAAQLERLARLRAARAGTAERPLRVVFLVPETSLWDVYGSIHAAMREDPRFCPRVIAFCRRGVAAAETEDQTRAFFADRAIEAECVGFGSDEPEPIPPDAADVLFYTLGSVAYPPAYQIEFTSLSFLTCYLPYGVMLAKAYDYQFNQSFHHAAWRLFAATPREAALHRRYSHRREDAVACEGYPKFDVLHAVPRDPAARPTVIWAPHWTIGVIYPALNFGLFNEFAWSMLGVIDANPDIDFVFKPHPTLAHACQATGYMPDGAYQAWLATLGQRPNVAIFAQGDYAALFARSDGMLTDSISFLAEYMLADRPLLFLDRADRAKLAPVGEAIIASHQSGTDLAAIERFLETCVRGRQDPGRQARDRARRVILGHGPHKAGAAIRDHLIAAITG
jgi:hypothetical protein